MLISDKINDLKFSMQYKYIFEKYGYNFSKISRCEKNLPESFIEYYFNKLNHNYILKHNILSVDFLDRHIHDLVGSYKVTCKYQKLDLIFIDKYKDILYWSYIIIFQKPPFDFLVKHVKYINLKFLDRCITVFNCNMRCTTLTLNQLLLLRKLRVKYEQS